MRNDRRSLALGLIIASRLDDEMISRAKLRLSRWVMSNSGIHPERANDWFRILDSSKEDIAHVLTSDDEQSSMLRIDSPFAGEIHPRERAEIWRNVK